MGLEVTLEPIYGEPITLKCQLELSDIRFINFFLDFIITTLIRAPPPPLLAFTFAQLSFRMTFSSLNFSGLRRVVLTA